MTPTLRQAARLAEKIAARIRGLFLILDAKPAANETVPADALEHARLRATNQDRSIHPIKGAPIALHQAVGRANAETGISDLLGERAVFSDLLAHLEAFAKIRPPCGSAAGRSGSGGSAGPAIGIALRRGPGSCLGPNLDLGRDRRHHRRGAGLLPPPRREWGGVCGTQHRASHRAAGRAEDLLWRYGIAA